MKDLKELNITGVDNIGGIEYATNCEELNISYSYNLDDISNLGYLTKLKKLTLNNTNVCIQCQCTKRSSELRIYQF